MTSPPSELPRQSAPALALCPLCGHGLTPGMERCSECATPRTDFASLMTRGRQDRRIALVAFSLAASPWVTQAWLLGMLVVARLELGRWPIRSGADDPKGIPIVSGMMTVGAILLLALPALALATLMLLLLLAARRAKGPRIGSVWIPAGLAIAGWFAGFTLLRLDPAQALYWFMD